MGALRHKGGSGTEFVNTGDVQRDSSFKVRGRIPLCRASPASEPLFYLQIALSSCAALHKDSWPRGAPAGLDRLQRISISSRSPLLSLFFSLCCARSTSPNSRGNGSRNCSRIHPWSRCGTGRALGASSGPSPGGEQSCSFHKEPEKWEFPR